MASSGGFFEGLSATRFIDAAVNVFANKEAAKVAKYEAQTRQHETAQRANLEAAQLSRQSQIVTAELTRKTFDNEQMWKLASWLTLAVSSTLVGAVVLKIIREK